MKVSPLGTPNERAATALSVSNPKLALLAFVIVAVLNLARLVALIEAGPEIQITMVPDDAFYYAVLAHNFADMGQWTFDGTNPSTGFHLLYGYALSLATIAFGQLDFPRLLLVVGLVNILLISGGAALVALACNRLVGVQSLVGVMLPFTAPIVLLQPTLLMESGLVICLASATLFLFTHQDQNRSPGLIVLAGLLGFMCVMTRTEMGGFSFIFCAVFGLRLLVCDHESPGIQVPVAVFVGSLVGVAVVSLHCLWVSGHLLQASALMKKHWGTVHGYGVKPVLNLVSSLIGFDLIDHITSLGPFVAKRLRLAVLITLAVVGLRAAQEQALRKTLIYGCVATAVFYILLVRLARKDLDPSLVCGRLRSFGRFSSWQRVHLAPFQHHSGLATGSILCRSR